jgi:hypothetical protein
MPFDSIVTGYHFERVADFFLRRAFDCMQTALLQTAQAISFLEFLSNLSADTEGNSADFPEEDDNEKAIFDDLGIELKWEDNPAHIAIPEHLFDFDESEPRLIIIPKWRYLQAITYAKVNSSRKLPRNQRIESIHIIGHVVNLAAFIETLSNHKLYYLRAAKKMDEKYYSSMERVQVLPKILFLFKAEILCGQLNIEWIKYLFKMRNHAVHYKGLSDKVLTPTIAELLNIWREIDLLLEYMGVDLEMEEMQVPLNDRFSSYVNKVKTQWLEST